MFKHLKSLTAHPAVLLGGSLVMLASAWRLAPHLPVTHLRTALEGTTTGGTESLRTAFSGLLGVTAWRGSRAEPAKEPVSASTLDSLAEGEMYQPDELSWHHWMS